MPDHTTTSAAAYLTERGYKVKSKRDGTELPPTSGTVKQWCERGKIKARKAGWVWLIDEGELNRLLKLKDTDQGTIGEQTTTKPRLSEDDTAAQ